MVQIGPNWSKLVQISLNLSKLVQTLNIFSFFGPTKIKTFGSVIRTNTAWIGTLCRSKIIPFWNPRNLLRHFIVFLLLLTAGTLNFWKNWVRFWVSRISNCHHDDFGIIILRIISWCDIFFTDLIFLKLALNILFMLLQR